MFQFSLLDKLEHCAESNVYDDNNHEGSSSSLEDVLTPLNDQLHKALDFYNTEIMKISLINQDMDRISKKNDKILEKFAMIKDMFQDLTKYIDTNYNNINSHCVNMKSTLEKMHHSLDDCITHVNGYYEEESNKVSVEYNTSLKKINSLDSIFKISKINEHLCPICIRNQSTHFTLPCGHVYCEDCSKKLSVTCFICRENIYKVNALYFS